MAYTHLLYHIIFRTKDSIPAIPVEHEKPLYTYMWGVVKNHGGVLYRLNGMPDHIYMFLQLPPTVALSDFMRNLKTSSAKYIQEHREDYPRFHGWAKSYCALSYCADDKEKIINYICNQKEHHKKVSFREELQKWLEKGGVEVDMKYFLAE